MAVTGAPILSGFVVITDTNTQRCISIGETQVLQFIELPTLPVGSESSHKQTLNAALA